jgi:AbrB family looped-hinge helix DNA binding protein
MTAMALRWYLGAMRVSIDRAGRVVVPKPLREQLGLSPDTPLEIEAVDGHLELHTHHEQPQVIEGPNGPVIAATGTTVSDEDVRTALEATRERR